MSDHAFSIPPALERRQRDFKQCIWFRIGTLRDEMKDHDLALAAFEKVLVHNPSNAAASAKAGILLMKKECYTQAISYLHSSVSVNPNNPQAWAALAQSYVMTEELDNAYQAYYTALNKLPHQSNPTLWFGIGILYDRFGMLHNALQAFHAVLNISPNFERADEVCYAVGLIYKEQHKYDLAHKYMSKVVSTKVQHQPAYAEALYQIGHIHELAGNDTSAMDAYHGSVSCNPNHLKALQALGWFTHKAGNYDEAVRLLQHASQVDSNDPRTYYLLGRVSMSANNYRVAYESYQKAVYRDGKDANFWCAIGVLYFHMRQHRDAMDAYTRAIYINPQMPDVWYDMGTLYEVYGQYNDAVDAYRRTAKLQPNDTQATQRLNVLQMSMNNGVTPPTPNAVPRAEGPMVSPNPASAVRVHVKSDVVTRIGALPQPPTAPFPSPILGNDRSNGTQLHSQKSMENGAIFSESPSGRNNFPNVSSARDTPNGNPSPVVGSRAQDLPTSNSTPPNMGSAPHPNGLASSVFQSPSPGKLYNANSGVNGIRKEGSASFGHSDDRVVNTSGPLPRPLNMEGSSNLSTMNQPLQHGLMYNGIAKGSQPNVSRSPEIRKVNEGHPQHHVIRAGVETSAAPSNISQPIHSASLPSRPDSTGSLPHIIPTYKPDLSRRDQELWRVRAPENGFRSAPNHTEGLRLNHKQDDYRQGAPLTFRSGPMQSSGAAHLNMSGAHIELQPNGIQHRQVGSEPLQNINSISTPRNSFFPHGKASLQNQGDGHVIHRPPTLVPPTLAAISVENSQSSPHIDGKSHNGPEVVSMPSSKAANISDEASRRSVSSSYERKSSVPIGLRSDARNEGPGSAHRPDDSIHETGGVQIERSRSSVDEGHYTSPGSLKSGPVVPVSLPTSSGFHKERPIAANVGPGGEDSQLDEAMLPRLRPLPSVRSEVPRRRSEEGMKHTSPSRSDGSRDTLRRGEKHISGSEERAARSSREGNHHIDGSTFAGKSSLQSGQVSLPPAFSGTETMPRISGSKGKHPYFSVSRPFGFRSVPMPPGAHFSGGNNVAVDNPRQTSQEHFSSQSPRSEEKPPNLNNKRHESFDPSRLPTVDRRSSDTKGNPSVAEQQRIGGSALEDDENAARQTLSSMKFASYGGNESSRDQNSTDLKSAQTNLDSGGPFNRESVNIDKRPGENGEGGNIVNNDEVRDRTEHSPSGRADDVYFNRRPDAGSREGHDVSTPHRGMNSHDVPFGSGAPASFSKSLSRVGASSVLASSPSRSPGVGKVNGRRSSFDGKGVYGENGRKVGTHVHSSAGSPRGCKRRGIDYVSEDHMNGQESESRRFMNIRGELGSADGKSNGSSPLRPNRALFPRIGGRSVDLHVGSEMRERDGDDGRRVPKRLRQHAVGDDAAASRMNSEELKSLD